MEKYLFGPTEVELPRIGQGTWNMERDDHREVIRAIQRGLDLGLTHIDTAEMYGDGEVEKLIAKAIEGRRDEVYLASKVLPWNASYEGTIRACERSLHRLQTDYLDLYLLHWSGPYPLAETIHAFETLRESKKILAYGVSNFNVDDLENALEIAGKGRIACNQVLYHLGRRYIEHAIIPWCMEHCIAVVGYSPFGSGHFPALSSASGKVLKDIADACGGTPRQVALRFLLRFDNMFTIPKSSRLDHLEEIAGTNAVQLTEEDIRCIEQAFPREPLQAELPII